MASRNGKKAYFRKRNMALGNGKHILEKKCTSKKKYLKGKTCLLEMEKLNRVYESKQMSWQLQQESENPIDIYGALDGKEGKTSKYRVA